LSIHFLQPIQHVVAHMCEYNPLTCKFRPAFGEGLVIKVKFHFLFKGVRFADEKIGVVRRLQQYVGPFRVAGISNDSASNVHTQRIRRSTGKVEHGKSRHLTIANEYCDLGTQFDELDWKALLHFGRFRKEHFHSLADTRPDVRWPGDDEWLCSFRKLCIKNKKRNAAEMVAMKMRNQDRANCGRVYS